MRGGGRRSSDGAGAVLGGGYGAPAGGMPEALPGVPAAAAGTAPAAPIVAEEFEVEPEDIGRVIGKQGAYIKQIREISGCVIRVTTGPKATVSLRGSRNGVEIARSMVLDVAGNLDTVCFLREVDPVAYFGILRNPQWLSLQAERAGVTVDVKQRTLKITTAGVPGAAHAFRDFLRKQFIFMAETADVEVKVPVRSLELIQNSSQIEDLVHNHKLQLDLRKVGNGAYMLTFRGPRVVAAEAFKIADCALGGAAAPVTTAAIPVWPFLFHDIARKKLNDFRSDILFGVENAFGVTVDLTTSSASIKISGSNPADVHRACHEVEATLQYYFGTQCASIAVPWSALDHLCCPGNGDAGGPENSSPGVRFEARMRAEIPDLMVSYERGRVWICGSAAVAERGYKMLLRDLARWDATRAEIRLDNRAVAALLAGAPSDILVLKRIQQTCNCTLRLSQDNYGAPVLQIAGATAEDKFRAIAAVRAAVDMVGSLNEPSSPRRLRSSDATSEIARHRSNGFQYPPGDSAREAAAASGPPRSIPSPPPSAPTSAAFKQPVGAGPGAAHRGPGPVHHGPGPVQTSFRSHFTDATFDSGEVSGLGRAYPAAAATQPLSFGPTALAQSERVSPPPAPPPPPSLAHAPRDYNMESLRGGFTGSPPMRPGTHASGGNAMLASSSSGNIGSHHHHHHQLMAASYQHGIAVAAADAGAVDVLGGAAGHAW